ncbi:GAF domain-containing protein [Roseomonas sp. AR75]|uniref:GAF domain-containing protein n=1 Tax=Roseomonas sp. AR75 TaxID=2562311 RepID=UPI0010BF68B1|nr:GAF domain-containing protein [Roseomonas sp. AR75]
MSRAEPAPHYAAVVAAAAEGGQPAPLFAALDKAMGAAIGHRLFTILVVHPGAEESQRYYSNMPREYPVGGRKPINRTHWFQRVLGEGQAYIGRTYADIQDVFFDHELIRSLGCESVLNVPVRWDGRSIGTINLLHEAQWYTEADVAAAEVFAALAVPGLMKVIAEG